MLEDITDDPILNQEQLKKRTYIRIAFFGSVVLIVAIVFGILFLTKSEPPKVEEEIKESAKAGVIDLIELSRIKNIEIQYYNAGASLIANTPEELLVNLKLEGWEIHQIPLALGFSRSFTELTTGKKVTTWIRVFSSSITGREEMHNTLIRTKKDPNTIVSENHSMGSGGFITNDGKEITQWFYYEPNIVVKASMLKSEGGSLQEVSEWAHRVNYSINSVLE